MTNQEDLPIANKTEPKIELTLLQMESESILNSIIQGLVDASLITFPGKPSSGKFIANDKEANRGWEQFVKIYLTENPKLLPNETFCDFIHRRSEFFVRLDKLLKQPIPEGETVFIFLYDLIGEAWDKLVITALNRFVGSFVVHEGKNKSFDVNDYKIAEMSRTLLHRAITKHQVRVLEELLKYWKDLECGAMVAEVDPVKILIGRTPLHDAAANGSYQCMEILVRKKVTEKERKKIINATEINYKSTPLHYAAQQGSLRCVKLLVENGANLNAKDSEGKMPYQLAYEKDHQTCGNYLIQDMRLKKIHLAGGGYGPYAEKLTIKKSKDEELNAVELDSMAVPIQHKLRLGPLDKIISLLDLFSAAKLMQVNRFFASVTKENFLWERYVKDKLTANPQLLLKENYYDYLKRHADVLMELKHLHQQKIVQPQAVFDLLCKIALKSWEKLFETILNNYPSFDVNSFKDEGKRYLIHYVARLDNPLMFQSLQEHKVDLKKCAAGYIVTDGKGAWIEERGNNPLQEAVKFRSYGCMKILLNSAKKGAFSIDYITLDSIGRSALHLAAGYGDLISIKLLVNHGASLEQEDSSKNTAYQIAQYYQHVECADYLARKMHEKNIPVVEVCTKTFR